VTIALSHQRVVGRRVIAGWYPGLANDNSTVQAAAE
jgi:hypothetical protein